MWLKKLRGICFGLLTVSLIFGSVAVGESVVPEVSAV